MKLTFVNVGYGEAILLEWEESGHTFTELIDGGSSEEREYQARSSERIPIWKYLKKIGIERLDLMVCTHIHEDHVGGLVKIAQLYPVKEFWQGFSPEFYKKMYGIDP